MTTSAELRQLFIGALKGATDAGVMVFSPFDWPTDQAEYPHILVRAPKERKESLGPNAPIFNVTTTLVIIARTQCPASADGSGSARALRAAETLKFQIETALINNPQIWALPSGGQRISQFSSVESELTTSSEGSMPVAELLMHIEVEFVQGPVDFFPIPSVPLETIGATVSEPSGTVEPYFSITLPQ